MELLLDTHILLWLVTDSPLLSSKARESRSCRMIDNSLNTETLSYPCDLHCLRKLQMKGTIP